MTPRLALAALALLALALAPVRSDAAPPDPRADVERRYEVIKKAALTAADQPELEAKLMAALSDFLDYERFSARTLKGTWEGLAPEQRARFTDLFRRLIIQTYAKRFEPGTGFEVTYRGATEHDPDGDARVKTTVHSGKVAADVTYHLHRPEVEGKAKWQAFDLEIDEVSMALNWRTQFRRIIQRDGFDALISKIARKVGETP